MQFTERELTVGVDQIAQQVFANSQPRRRLRKQVDTDAAWRELPPFEKYQHKAAVADMVIPILLALPERPTVGATPEFTDEEWAEAAESTELPPEAVMLAVATVAAMPIRQDPDALIIPDHL